VELELLNHCPPIQTHCWASLQWVGVLRLLKRNRPAGATGCAPSNAFIAVEMDYYNEQRISPRPFSFALTDNPSVCGLITEKTEGLERFRAGTRFEPVLFTKTRYSRM